MAAAVTRRIGKNKAAGRNNGKGKAGAAANKEERKYPRIDERGAANFVSLQEVVHAARRNLSQDLWDHLSGGSDSETTLARNRMGFDRLALRQRVLVDVRNIDISTSILGRKIASPVFF
ncbi:MAG TPA: alpha-hydroxy-acid oxidizing protein, partial [Burkholderiales bacterium]|nr:alpha-hydroxy-acid oxidizing protein [Burkholderiales bacterium]